MTETEAERRLRILADEVDRLKGLVDRQDQSVNPAAPVSLDIGFDCAEIVSRDPGPEELMAVGAACELLRDWFDANNPKRQKVAAANKKAPK